MENKTEDEIRKRWEQEAKDKADRDEGTQQRPKKRVRAIEYDDGSGTMDQIHELLRLAKADVKAAEKGRATAKKKTGRAAAGKAKAKVTEIIGNEDDMVVELD